MCNYNIVMDIIVVIIFIFSVVIIIMKQFSQTLKSYLNNNIFEDDDTGRGTPLVPGLENNTDFKI